ncbi:hypothetical protein ACROYT_G039388 [Oculina patagonica]
MASGIKMSQECKEAFTAIKDKHIHGHAIMMIKDKKEIVVEKIFDPRPDKTPETSERIFDEMKKEILECGGPRYILFDMSYQRSSGTCKDVVVYIYWCPDTMKIGEKMIYAASNDTLKKAFTGIKHYECHDEDEFSYKEIAGDLKLKDRA